MVTKETLEEQITQKQSELETLKSAHDQMVRDYQQQIVQNQSQFQQLTGALSQLQELIKLLEPNPT